MLHQSKHVGAVGSNFKHSLQNPHQPYRRGLEATTRVCPRFRRNLRRGVHHITPDVDVRLIHLYSARFQVLAVSTVSNTGQYSRRRGLAWTPALHYPLLSVHTVDKRGSQSAVTGETTGGAVRRVMAGGRWPVPDPSVQSLWLRAPRCSHLARPHWAARRVAGRQRRAEAATLRAPERRSPPPHHVLSNERELDEKKPCPTRALHPADYVHH